MAERRGQRVRGAAKLSDHVFPESVWKAFGEHVEESEHEEELGYLDHFALISEVMLSNTGRPGGVLGQSRRQS